MLNVSNMLGLTGLMITTSLTSFPFCNIYQSMKRVNPNEAISFKCLLMTLAQYVLWMLYSYQNDLNHSYSDYFMLISFSYSSLVYMIYFNMYLFSINRKNYMLIYTLLLVAMIYAINMLLNPWFIGMCGVALIIADMIMSLKSIRPCVINKNATGIDFSKVFGYFFMGFFWLFYALFNMKWWFAIGNGMIIALKTIEGIVFYWGIGRIGENNMSIRIVRVVLFIKPNNINNDNDYNKAKELIQLKEDTMIHQPSV